MDKQLEESKKDLDELTTYLNKNKKRPPKRRPLKHVT